MSASVLKLAPRESIADVLYHKDSLILCRSCGKPLYRLQASICAGEGAGPRTLWKFAPVSPDDLAALMLRSDVEAGHRAIVGAMSMDARRLHCERIRPLTDGMYADCPACDQPFVYGRIPEGSETRFGDKGFIITLAIIPPQGSARRVI